MMRHGFTVIVLALLVATLGSSLVAQAHDDWVREIYADGLADGDLPVQITSRTAGKSGGLTLRKGGLKKGRYKLVLTGQVVRGTASLRIRLDDGEPEWLNPPTKGESLELPVVDAGRLEVLIYSDAAFAYRLHDISLQPCPLCRSARERLAPALDLFPDWKIKLYGEPTLARTGAMLRIENANVAPAGLVFERDGLSRFKRYRVSVGGVAQTDNVIARFDVGGRAPVWAHMRGGDQSQRTLIGVTSLKVWVYADKPFTYVLGKLTLEECGLVGCAFDVGTLFADAAASVRDGFSADVTSGIGALLHTLSYLASVGLIAVAFFASVFRR